MSFNYEAKNSYVFQVEFTDTTVVSLPVGKKSFANVTVGIRNVNEAPTVSVQDGTGTEIIPAVTTYAINLPENTPTSTSQTGLLVGKLTAADPDQGSVLTHTLVGGTQTNGIWIDRSGGFSYDPVTGEIRIANGAILDFEKFKSFRFSITVADNGIEGLPRPLTKTASILIGLLNENEAPIITSLATASIREKNLAGALVMQVRASDRDANSLLTYSIVSQSDSMGTAVNLFAIDPVTGRITVPQALSLNYDLSQFYDVEVSVTDNGSPSLQVKQWIRINIINLP